MKHILISALLLLTCIHINAQSEYEQKYFKEAYSDTFKNESVVITRLFEEYTFTNAGGADYKINVVYRAQYKLKDISALDAFGTLSKNKDLKRYVLNQIKPNGQVNLIYEYYDKSYPDDGYEDDENEDEDSPKKKDKEEIPLENLEIGDIIDYQFEYTYTTKIKDFRKLIINNGNLDNRSVNIVNQNRYRYLLFKNRFLEEQYPIASGIIIYHVPEELKLAQKALNCNFKFTSTPSGSGTLYECRLTNVKAYKSEDFSYSYLNYPVIKYTLIQTDPIKLPSYPYQFEEGKTSRDDIAALGRKIYNDKNYILKYLYYLNTTQYPQGYKEVSLDKFFSTFMSTFTKKEKSKIEKLNMLHEYLTNNDDLNENQFSDMSYAVIMARFCNKIGLPYKMMACMHKYDGKFGDVISPYEITWGVYVPDKKGRDIFVTSYGKSSNIYELFGSLSGTDVVIFDPKTQDPYQVIQYPVVDSKMNISAHHSDITLSKDSLFDYRFVIDYTYSGQQRYSINDDVIGQFRHIDLNTPSRFSGMVNYNEIYSDEIAFGKSYDAYFKILKELNRVDSMWGVYINEYYKTQMLSFMYNEYHLDKIQIDSFNLNRKGGYTDNDTAIYGFRVDFKGRGILEKTSGDSMLVMNLGKLISDQYKISNYKVNERYGDVYNSNQRLFTWDIDVELPKGYKALNLSDFNQLYENEAGLFKTEIREEKDKLVLKITKIYKTNYLPKDKWMEMVDFLRPAASYFNKKLLLEKK